MYNQWALQQVAALQLATALQQQQLQHQQNLQSNLQHIQNQSQQAPQQHLPQHLTPQSVSRNSPVTAAQSFSDGDDSDDEDDEQKRTLFCANLDDRVTEELLYEVFLQAGPIESVRIPKDNTGRQRTFGFVTYVHACTIPYALRLYQGLTLFRKALTIKFQGNNSAPSTPQQRRSLPSDCEAYNRRSGGNSGSGCGSYDNSSHRSGNFSGCKEAAGGAKTNPFRREDHSNDWVKRRNNEKERISKHVSGQSRPHQNTAPYQRRSGGSEGSNERGHERLGNDYQRRHQHSGSNRRSEQRSNNSRR